MTDDSLTGKIGRVRWFDAKRGFGFIGGPDRQDIFVHYSKIEGEGFRELRDGERVEYDAERRDRGWVATRVHTMRPQEPPVGPERDDAEKNDEDPLS